MSVPDENDVGKSLEKLKKSLEKRTKLLHDSELKLEELDASIQVAKQFAKQPNKPRASRDGSTR